MGLILIYWSNKKYIVFKGHRNLTEVTIRRELIPQSQDNVPDARKPGDGDGEQREDPAQWNIRNK